MTTSDPVSPAGEPRGIDVTRVGEWILRDVPGSVAPFRYQLIAAGGSNLTFQVTDAAGQRWALRRPPVGSTLATAHDMAREFRIMTALRDRSDVPVPSCVAECADTEVTSAPFYVMEFVDGRILRDQADVAGITAEQADRATDSLIDTQLTFHRIDLDAVGLADLGRHDNYVGRQLKRWRTQVARVDLRPVPLLYDLHDRLAAAQPPEVAAPGLAHGDYRFDNTMLDDDFSVKAVFDWELCTIGDPIADLAWSLQYWSDPGDELLVLVDPPTLAGIFPRRDEVIRRYAERSGFDLSHLPYYVAFTWWKQACIVEGAFARRLAGAGGGMASSSPVDDIGRRVDAYLAEADRLLRHPERWP